MHRRLESPWFELPSGTAMVMFLRAAAVTTATRIRSKMATEYPSEERRPILNLVTCMDGTRVWK
jgi:hypothetical protein